MSQREGILRGFVVFEGIDGTGTTTQLARLGRRLDRAGVPYHASCEPTPGPIGTMVRQALSGAYAALPETVARLFAADRGEHLYGSGGIVERAGRGEIAVSDRYIFSSLAYQGLTCGPDLPAALNQAFPLPELLLFFQLDPVVAAGRMAGRAELDIYENVEFQRRVAAAYAAVLGSFEGAGMTIARIDAREGPDDVESAVWNAIAPIVERVARR